MSPLYHHHLHVFPSNHLPTDHPALLPPFPLSPPMPLPAMFRVFSLAKA